MSIAGRKELSLGLHNPEGAWTYSGQCWSLSKTPKGGVQGVDFTMTFCKARVGDSSGTSRGTQPQVSLGGGTGGEEQAGPC